MPRKSKGWKVWIERSGKSYRARWSGSYGTGQQVFIYKDDARELAREKKRDFERMGAGLPPAIKIASAVTVQAYAKTYLANSEKEKSASTYRNFDMPSVMSIAEMFPRLALPALTDQHIRDWKFSVENKYRGTTASMYFRGVRTFLNSAVKAGHIATNPARHVSRPIEGPGGRALRDEELTALLADAPTQLLRAGTFSLNTMLRINEVLMFDWAWTWRLKDGALMGRIPADKRKTRRKIREDCIFPINAAAEAAMGEPLLSGRVFPWSAITVQHQIIKARKDAKLADDITFHCFRHTGASRYLREGGHMEDLLKTRLWSDPRSLLRYVHVDEETLSRRFASLKYPYPAPTKQKAPAPVRDESL